MEVQIIKGPLFEKVEKEVYKKLGNIIKKSVNNDKSSEKSA